MSVDPFTGKKIDFGVIIRVGPRRKDGKFPVTTTLKSTGQRFNQVRTAEQVAKDIETSRKRFEGACEVYGWSS
jgi:hypothetical protein